MRTVTLEILKDQTMNLLRDLEQLKLLRFRNDSHQTTKPLSKKVTFDAASIDTTGHRFDREEANER